MEQFANCTTLVGDMVIQGGYQRAILLPNMAHMDGTIRESHNGPRLRVSVLDAPKPVYMGGQCLDAVVENRRAGD
ncbi:hypothetical protein BDW71DRAFT_181920 [Aspergillus fruticulosus]